VNDVDALYRRVVGIDAGQHAVFKECFQRMLGQDGTVLVWILEVRQDSIPMRCAAR
jgi:hypothetical protein